MEFRVLGGALWRQRVLALLILMVTAGSVALGIYLAPKTYTATATVQVESADRRIPPDPALLGTVAQAVSSRELVAGVQARVSSGRSDEELRRSLEGIYRTGTTLVTVVAEADAPVTAARVANTAAILLPLHDPTGGELAYTVSEYAEAPEIYSSPDLVVSFVAGTVLALILAAGGALVRDYRVNTVDDAASVEEASVAPLLAHVDTPEDPTTLPALYPGTAAAEVFRQLRAAVESETRQAPVHRVVVAGVHDGDVSMWIGSNLAIALAQGGHRVLLVDGRAAGGVTLTGEDPEAPGLYDVLLGADLDEALVPGPVDGLSVLPAGVWERESGQRLVQTQFVDTMTAHQDRFDYVLVLAPPLSGSEDALMMAAGALLMQAVPRRGVTASALRAHADRVRSVGARLLGSVLVGRAERRTA